MTRPTLPPITWLSLSTEELGRWTWQQHLRWPAPLDSSAVGSWEPELEELLAGLPGGALRPRGEERLLASLAEVLAAPDYCTFAIRAAGGVETHYAAVSRGPEVVVLVDAPGQARLGRVDETLSAVTVAAQLPRVLAAPTVRTEVPAGTAAVLLGGVQRGADAETMQAALAAAGLPPELGRRLLADPAAVTATGMLGAVRYGADGPAMSPRCGSWTELPDGALLSVPGPGGAILLEPFTSTSAARCLADALSAVRGG